jgi:hypothetical protein
VALGKSKLHSYHGGWTRILNAAREFAMAHKHVSFSGYKSAEIYNALNPDGILGRREPKIVEYRELDNRITISATGNRAVSVLTQWDGGMTEVVLTKLDTGEKTNLAVDTKAVLSAMREALGRQSPVQPVYRHGDYSLR